MTVESILDDTFMAWAEPDSPDDGSPIPSEGPQGSIHGMVTFSDYPGRGDGSKGFTSRTRVGTTRVYQARTNKRNHGGGVTKVPGYLEVPYRPWPSYG